MRRPVDVEPSVVMDFGYSIRRSATIFATILHADTADIHMADDVTVYRYVLSNHETVALGQRESVKSPGKMGRGIASGDAFE